MDNEDLSAAQGDIIVKADEIDDADADLSSFPSSIASEFRVDHKPDRVASSATIILSRPNARRDSIPAPPRQPPPPAPVQDDSLNPAASLSLAQLRRLVSDLPKLETTAYAYTYEDTQTFPEELEEWFQYTEEDAEALLRGRVLFEDRWHRFLEDLYPASGGDWTWTEASMVERKEFVTRQLQGIQSPDLLGRVMNLEILTYVALGVWHDTAGHECGTFEFGSMSFNPPNDRFRRSALQLQYIRNAVEILEDVGALPKLYDMMARLLDTEKTNGSKVDIQDYVTADVQNTARDAKSRELNGILTLLYLIVESGRQQIIDEKEDTIRRKIVALDPNILQFMSSLVARLRWDDSFDFPLTRVLLLFWKTTLVVFGGAKQLAASSQALRTTNDNDAEENEAYITASPLDYHLFRQEITSKYPAYNPPPPLIPIEPDNSSILPPLPNHPSRMANQDSQQTVPGTGSNRFGKSIFHQPVHIATPAPSPPPSPAGPGGKGGKKQNYQTNQNFPFLYPPLDGTSNIVGGKGTAALQDKLVQAKWEGADVPASIVEAGQLFASRTRMSRALRQLWDVREEYMKFERGWDEPQFKLERPGLDLDVSRLKLEDEDQEEDGDNKADSTTKKRLIETANEDVQARLDAVEAFYQSNLPHLQSIVIVLLKVTLSNITALAAQMNGQNGMPGSFSLPDGDEADPIPKRPKRNVNLMKQISNIPNGVHHESESAAADKALQELNTIRLREITSKAVAGILINLLRWFKLSHILKYEYLTQLLLDSNYLPIALKLFAHQDIDRAVDHKNDREDQDFFHFCQIHSKNPPPLPVAPAGSSSSSSEDEAQPPPILKRRKSLTTASPPHSSPSSSPSPPPQRPEVDELGYPTTALPQEPLTTYAPRFFYTTITHLRLLQKITKRKAHRALLLVTYKSSPILRKALKIPQTDLRLYTLKLFKSQVPYCGRKWRQSNMRVITAIYLHCKPELRDEWLSGSEMESVVEEAVPLEQAGRSLVHWWHLRNYRSAMESGGVVERGDLERDDFFARELEKMGWGPGEMGDGGEGGESGDEGHGGGKRKPTEWEGGPLALEGW